MPRTHDVQPLDDQLCFALYAASRAMTTRYRPLLDELGLTFPQYVVMVSLWTEGPATVSQLGTRLRLDSGTLSPLLKRLEALGLVSRTRRRDDERSVQVGLTDAGERLRTPAARVGALVASTLDGIDVPTMLKELRMLEERLREHS